MAKWKHVRKRDGRLVPFDESKIADAIFKAAQAVGGEDRLLAEELASVVTLFLEKNLSDESSGNSPSIEEIQDMVEKVLIETGHAKTAKAYILYRDKRAKTRGALRVRKEAKQNLLFDDMAPMVDAGARDEVTAWSKGKIIAALEKEADITPDVANDIASEVERKVFISGIERISTSLIRALVDNELFERGFGAKLQEQTLIGMPKYDLDQLIFANNGNGCQSRAGPSYINLAIAKNTLKQYALQAIFSRDVADAHLRGVIHIHALDQPAHLHRCCSSLEYVKRYGLSPYLPPVRRDALPRLLQSEKSDASSEQAECETACGRAAPDAQTLVDQAIVLIALQSQYCVGYTGIDCVNTSLAPYVVDHTDGEMRAIAKRLILPADQAAHDKVTVARDNGLIVSSPMLSIYTDIPAFMANLPAIGPNGQHTGKTYSDYSDVALRLADAFIEAFLEAGLPADGCSDPVASAAQRCLPAVDMPKLWVHCTENSFDGSSGLSSGLAQLSVLKRACKLASEGVSVGFVIDRNDVSVFAAPPLRIPIQDSYMIFNPESMRFFSFQNASLNLPQAAYRARNHRQGGVRRASLAMEARTGNVETLASDIEAIYPEIDKAIELAVKAHVEKRMFLSKLMLPDRPLSAIAKDAADGKPFVDLNKAACLIDIVGLNECLQYLTGRELHDGGEILKLGLRLVSYIYFKVKEEGKRQGLRVFLDDLAGLCPWRAASSGEGDAAARLAQIDARNFPEIQKAIKSGFFDDGGRRDGESETKALRYTNGFRLRCPAPGQVEAGPQNAPTDALSRMRAESRFHAMVESGAAVIALGEKELSDFCSDGSPPQEGIFELVKQTLLETQISQLVVSVAS